MSEQDPAQADESRNPGRGRSGRMWIAGWGVLLVVAVAWRLAVPFVEREDDESAPKVRRVKGATRLWASGPLAGPWKDWFDVTGAELDPEQFEYGIGRDRIRSIDRPRFVRPGDPALEALIGPDPSACNVIGFAYQGQARAYPISVLNEHELVNDRVGGKPVTVGW